MVQEILQLLTVNSHMTTVSITVSVLVMCVAVLTLWKGERGAATRFLAAALVTGAFLEIAETMSLISSLDYMQWKRAAIFLESALPALLFLFSTVYARSFSWNGSQLITRLLIILSPLLLLSGAFFTPDQLFYSPDFISERMLFLNNYGFIFYIVVFIYLVAALFNLEATFRSAHRPEQWQIKFTILGAGTLLGLLVFYYSQGLLYRSINMNLSPLRTLAIFLSAIFLALSLRRGKRSIKIALSREIAFKSVILLITGGYLVMLGLLGEGLRYFGNASQQLIFMSVFFIGSVLLIVILLSEQMKRKIKVYINKNFFDNKYDYRVQWLKFTSRLAETRNNKELDAAILSFFCDTFAMGAGMIYLWAPEQRGYFNRNSYQTDSVSTLIPVNNSVVVYMREKGWVLNSDYFEPVVKEADILQISDDKIAFSVPIFMGDNLEGFIALLRPINRGEEYTYEDYDLMKTLAGQAAFALASARLTEQLAVAREMEAVGKITAFVMHDLKNLVYSLSLLSDNAVKYIGDPEFQSDMLETLGNTVTRMNALISRLNELPERQRLNLDKVNLLSLVLDTVASFPGDDIKVKGVKITVVADSTEISKVLVNLIINARDASPANSPVLIETGIENQAFIRVTDRGCGMTPEFIRDDLFTPFKTTKSKGLGIGLYQSRQIVQAHQGRIEVESTPGEGSVFTVWMPVSGPLTD